MNVCWCSHSVETKHLVVLDIVAQNREMEWGLQAAYEREMIKPIAWSDFLQTFRPCGCVAVLKLRWGRRRKWEKVWHLARAWICANVDPGSRNHRWNGAWPGLGLFTGDERQWLSTWSALLAPSNLIKRFDLGVDQTFLKVPAFSAAIRACCEKVKQWQHWHVWSTQVWYSRACLLALGRNSPLSRWFKYQFSVTLTWLKSWGSCFQATRFGAPGRNQGAKQISWCRYSPCSFFRWIVWGYDISTFFFSRLWRAGAWNDSRWGSLSICDVWVCKGAQTVQELCKSWLISTIT